MIRLRRLTSLGAAAAAVAALVAAGGGAGAQLSKTLAYRGTVTYAQPPGGAPNFIFPLYPLAYYSGTNIHMFQQMMYPPLYWFGKSGQPVVNYRRSLAGPPVYSNQGRTVTITLKHQVWSDGQPITTRDIQFWMNLLIANKVNWGAYVPGAFPDNVTKIAYPSATTFQLTFNRAYNPGWLLYNELSQITPIPQHAWDKTSTSGRIGNYDRTHRGAVAVYTYLFGQAKNLSTYATNPLWKVIDGPFRLSAFQPATGYTVFVPNTRYDGADRPHIAKFIEVPFTNDTAEFNALRAGQLDYGYLPVQDLPQRQLMAARGYRLDPWILWGISYFPMNFTNPTTGPIFRQLYIRQAMQHLINQPQYVKDIFKGYAVPTYGPVPIRPANPFVTAYEKDNPLPFSVSTARTLLRTHGWKVIPNGASVCETAGTGPNACGAGIRKGTALSFTLMYAAGVVTVAEEMQALKSTFSAAGIAIALITAPTNTVIADATPCNRKTGSGCHWDFLNWGGGWGYSIDYYPSGGEIFACGASSNPGDYCSATTDRYIQQTHVGLGTQSMATYENWLANQVPVLWSPTESIQLSEISNRLHGAVPQPAVRYEITPQDWTISG